MLLRRILWLIAALLALAIVAAALVPRDDSSDETPTVAAPPERATVKADIGASPARAPCTS